MVWDNIGDRVYETGLDQGVLYLPDDSAVPWNGLTSIIEQSNKESSPVYYDGKKINDLVVLGDFAGSMSALTYPDEFLEIEGLASTRRGVLFGDQRPKIFSLSYRTKIGNDLEGDVAGYKIHIIYNVTAIPSEKTYASIMADPTIAEFTWNITAVPEEISGFYPTAHIILNSRDLDPWLLEDLEDTLYGSSTADAILIPMSELISYINEWYRIKIFDNGDGTWTATSKRNETITTDIIEQLFTISQANVIYLNSTTYEISDTYDILDVP